MRTSTINFIQNTCSILHKNRQSTIMVVSLWSHYGWKSMKWEKLLLLSYLKLIWPSPLLYYSIIIKSQILHTMNSQHSEHMNYSYSECLGFCFCFCFVFVFSFCLFEVFGFGFVLLFFWFFFSWSAAAAVALD